MPTEHHPGTVSGVAFAPDGRLFIADEMEQRLWRLMADETDLEMLDGDAAPPVRSLWSFGGMIVGETGQRVHAVSEDGIHWRSATPGLQEAQ